MSASTVTSAPAAVQCSLPQGMETAARRSSLQGARRSTPVGGQAAKPPRLRLTRRGRIVLIGLPLVLLAAILLSLAGLLNSPAKAADTASGLAGTPAVSVTVQPGESLWAIAGAVDPGRDPRDVIADIVQLNDLEGGRVMPGQQLFVPSN